MTKSNLQYTFCQILWRMLPIIMIGVPVLGSFVLIISASERDVSAPLGVRRIGRPDDLSSPPAVWQVLVSPIARPILCCSLQRRHAD